MYYSKEPARKHLKAQTEIIILLGVVVVSVFVVVLVSQQFLVKPEPANVANLKAILKADVERLVQASATETIIKIGKQGGYLNVPAASVKFGEGKIPYWGLCQSKFIPSLEQIANNVKAGLEKKINSNDFVDIKKKYGKDVQIEKVARDSIDVLIRDQDVLVEVDMPTSIEGFPVQQPYRIAVPFALGRAYNFASDFVEDNSVNRHFDRFIASLFYHADERKLPTLGLLGKCGEAIFRTSEQLQKTVNRIVDYSTANVYLWVQPPPDEERAFLEYYIPSVNNRTYQDLDIQFQKGEGSSPKNFKPSSNPVSIVNSKPVFPPFVTNCLAPINVKYSLDMPMITTIKAGQYLFNFATLTSIDNNEIGICSAQGNFTEQKDPCSDSQCRSKITVKDTQGRPIPDTTVSFGPCLLDLTDESGVAEGEAQCGISELLVFNPDYNHFYDVVSTKDLDKTIILKNPTLIRFHFNRIAVNDISKTINFEEENTKDIFVTFKSKNSSQWNPVEVVLASLKEERIAQDNSEEEKKLIDSLYAQRSLDSNLTVAYTDGKTQSSIIEFANPTSLKGGQPARLEFDFSNSYTKNVAEAYLLAPNTSFVRNLIDKSNIAEAAFSKTFIPFENRSLIKLSWSSAAPEGFIKPGESRKFYLEVNSTKPQTQIAVEPKDIPEDLKNNASLELYNGITDVFQGLTSLLRRQPDGQVISDIIESSANSTTNYSSLLQPEVSGLSLESANYLPAGDYETEVRQHKLVQITLRYCKKFEWNGNCKKYTIENYNLTVMGITNFDFEVKEDDTDLYLNGFVPHFNSSFINIEVEQDPGLSPEDFSPAHQLNNLILEALDLKRYDIPKTGIKTFFPEKEKPQEMNTTYYYNDQLPALKEKCKVEPLSRTKPNSTCNFG